MAKGVHRRLLDLYNECRSRGEAQTVRGILKRTGIVAKNTEILDRIGLRFDHYPDKGTVSRAVQYFEGDDTKQVSNRIKYRVIMVIADSMEDIAKALGLSNSPYPSEMIDALLCQLLQEMIDDLDSDIFPR